ncbi:MAG: hypothetical protein KKG04_00435 [Candidatus Thermoplasmatota archaeon]|nr:hypothetical protein [Candidatus Thermoplasmatota archaeon]
MGYFYNFKEFFPGCVSGLVFSIEQLTQVDWQQPRYDMHRRKLQYARINKGCGVNKLYDVRNHRLVDAHCNQFSCEYCRPRLLKNLRINIIKYAHEMDLTRFVTITFGGEDLRRVVRPDNSFEYVMKRFNHWREYLKRKFKVKVSYINLVRSHQDGYCHLHLLMNRYIPKSWLSQSTRAVGLGSTNVKYVDIQRVSGYLSRYFSVKEHEWFLPEGIHHYSTSRDIHLNSYVPSSQWVYICMPQRFVKNSEGEVVRNILGEIECVCNHTEWYVKYPPPFDFLVAQWWELNNN